MYDNLNLKQVRAHLNEHGWETSTLDEVRNLPHGDDGQAHAYLIADGSIQEYRMWQVSRVEDDIPQDVIPSKGEHLVVIHDHIGFPGMYGETEYSEMGYVVDGLLD